jgi:excisionase family DNA binding protein
MTDDPMLTVKEVASELKLSERYITQMISEGKLQAVKFGKTYRIYRSELDRFIAERQTKRKDD